MIRAVVVTEHRNLNLDAPVILRSLQMSSLSVLEATMIVFSHLEHGKRISILYSSSPTKSFLLLVSSVRGIFPLEN